MKKIFSIIFYATTIFLLMFSINSNAESLDAIDITTTKQTVRPNEEVTLNIEFGKELGSYTFNIAYDNNLFDFVKVDGGKENNTGTKVIVFFSDETGGSAPRSNMSITFRAKSDITTSNPTDFSITAEGLASPDAMTTYDDITVPIVKNVVVEPDYKDYNITLSYTGEIYPNKEKNMELNISSTMGKYYEHARIIGEATTPDGATAKLLGTDEQSLEHDIIQSGWGDASGYEIGGIVNQTLHLRGLFSEVGKYTITIKLINRDDSDSIIASKTFDINVVEENITPPEEETPPEETTPEPPIQTPEDNTPNTEEQKPETSQDTEKEELPEKLPQTGFNIYMLVIPLILVLAGVYIELNKKD